LGGTWRPFTEAYTFAFIHRRAQGQQSKLWSEVVMFETPLLRSSNHGESWNRLFIDVPPPDPGSLGEGPWPDLTAVASDPRRAETLYVSSSTHGVLVSYDDGVSWKPLGDLPDKFVNTLAVTSEGIVFAVTRSGVYRYVPPPPRRRAAAKP
jgi:photosystem II stability/assembly factor-like uncharacterized protein